MVVIIGIQVFFIINLSIVRYIGKKIGFTFWYNLSCIIIKISLLLEFIIIRIQSSVSFGKLKFIGEYIIA